jgi:hypothetical protein
VAKEKANSSLVDEITSVASVRCKRGFRTWYERLPLDAQAELSAVKASFDHSLYEKNAFANAVIDACNRRGWRVCGRQGVIDWLERP